MAITSNAAGDFLNIKVNDDEISRLVHGVLSPAAIKRIQSRAINETMRWIRGQLSRRLLAMTGIQRKAFANRIKQIAPKNYVGGMVGKIWLGANPIDAAVLKDGSAANTGYMAGDYYFEGGFKSKMRSGHTGVFARKSRARLPIERQGVKVDGYFAETVRRLMPQAEKQLSQKTMRLVTFELEKAAR